MANSITWDSTSLSSASYGLTVFQQHVGAYSTVNVDVQAIPYAPGVSQYTGTNPKVFSVECLIDATSATHLTTCLDNLTGIFHTQEDKSLQFDDWYSDRFWYARYTGGLETVSLIGSYKASVTLNFVAADPVAYSLTEYEPDIYEIASSPSSFNVDGTDNVNGNTYTKPLWILIPDELSSNIVIANETTGDSLTWANSLNPGTWLIIACSAWAVATTSDGGTTVVPSMRTVSGIFPRLVGGQINTITVTNFVGNVVCNYYGRYL